MIAFSVLLTSGNATQQFAQIGSPVKAISLYQVLFHR
jgi:hypothetical protein